MEQIKMEILRGYLNFSEEVCNNTYKVIKNGFGKNISWAATINDYKTLKDFKRNYFDFTEYEVEVNNFNIGEVINLRDENIISNKYSWQYDEYFLIVNIDENTIILENYPTVATAIKAQKKRFDYK
ncbi:hypothetical protein [Flavobacterium psychrolimnae]|uniref:Uncharacterized protein n=1 Tax=Flavobacterium psychrolimnae TaxID=249351 RepID=A0A366B1W1_9FLAO|nr:hypothetical protein [Flavobacterium psychrolimnae]RBN50178.1 hypothetical protein DR980_08615 [Flavobacterium psychrolimnae]